MLRLMAEAADAPQELLPGVPLIEITGAGRVLIENHGGVTEYETDRMSKCQLVISGNLTGLDLERGNGS